MSAQDFLSLGLQVLGRTVLPCSATNERRYRGAFGASPRISSLIWTMLRHPIGGELIHLLMAFHFLKCYATETIQAALFKVDEKTFRKWQWMYVRLLSTLNNVSSLIFILFANDPRYS